MMDTPSKRFDYMFANPPFGVEWKIQEDYVKEEYADKGFNGRFGAGLPRINDGSLLFLQHMMSKMKQPEKDGQGSRIAVVFNGSPLFTGDAGSGESNIRRYVIETTCLKPLSRCRIKCSTTPAFIPTFGFYRIRKAPNDKAKCSWLTPRSIPKNAKIARQ